MSPVERRDFKDKQMNETMTSLIDSENKSLKSRLVFAAILYLGTLVAYVVIFLLKEPDETIKGLAYLNPAFLLASDVVIASLSPQDQKIRQDSSRGSFVYSRTFQSVILLLIRMFLCFNEQYWLANLAVIYFIVQLVCAYDASQTLFLNTNVTRNEQEDII